MAELLLVLEHMHMRGVAHRDLKPSNLLFDENMHLKLVDFGTAKFFDRDRALETPVEAEGAKETTNARQSEVCVRRTEGSEVGMLLPTGGTEMTTTPRKRCSLVGSEDYVAPEIIAGQPSGPAADLWSMGVLLFLFLSGESPFKGYNELQTFQNI